MADKSKKSPYRRGIHLQTQYAKTRIAHVATIPMTTSSLLKDTGICFGETATNKISCHSQSQVAEKTHSICICSTR